ncbi:hypothetical protein C0993_005802 [Termitomyces sp. T159_Od127]|nr:hypothetical protein C0993_005802 [Termitomyces sp. T159_Od127]
MSALSLAGQGVLTFPSTVVLPDWIPSNTAQQAPANTDSPILAAVAPPPPPHPLDAPTDAETQILTLTVTETLTITVPAAIASPSPPSTAAKPPKTKWRSPKRMRDLGAFNISAFSGGRDNLEIVQGIPSSIASFAVSNASFAASAPSPLDDESDADATQIHPRATPWPPNASSLQLLYPAGSINPARRPIGGAQFYAAPLDLTRARNVSLGYSAFFPADFDWVRGGKMPGLYGGRAGCSGGSAALDCWSTRLMWRSEGRGELYLVSLSPPLRSPNFQTHQLTNSPGRTVRPQSKTTPLALQRPALRLLRDVRPLDRARRVRLGPGALDARPADRHAQYPRCARRVLCA